VKKKQLETVGQAAFRRFC